MTRERGLDEPGKAPTVRITQKFFNVWNRIRTPIRENPVGNGNDSELSEQSSSKFLYSPPRESSSVGLEDFPRLVQITYNQVGK